MLETPSVSGETLTEESIAGSTRYPVMIIGGAEDKVNKCSILKAFFGSAGGREARLGIIPTASREPAAAGDRYYRIFSALGAAQVRVLDIRYRSECSEDRWINMLSECTGIFMTGGDQLRLRDVLGGTRLIDEIKTRLAKQALVIAGTSAGAAIMGEDMIAGGSSGESPNQRLVDLTYGLGFVPELLVDQHFHNRNRMARLLSAIAAHPTRIGVGIDEDTCAAMVSDSVFQVLGKGTITVVDPGSMTHNNYPSAEDSAPLSLHNLKVHVLNQGDRYDYKQRKVLQAQTT